MRSMVVSNEEGSEEDHSDIEEAGPVEFDAGEEHVLDTKKYGKLNFCGAEAQLLNGGRSTIGTKTRKARFTGDTYTGIVSESNQPFCGCSSAYEIGKTSYLPMKSDPEKKFRGGNAPLKFFVTSYINWLDRSPNLWCGFLLKIGLDTSGALYFYLLKSRM